MKQIAFECLDCGGTKKIWNNDYTEKVCSYCGNNIRKIDTFEEITFVHETEKKKKGRKMVDKNEEIVFDGSTKTFKEFREECDSMTTLERIESLENAVFGICKCLVLTAGPVGIFPEKSKK